MKRSTKVRLILGLAVAVLVSGCARPGGGGTPGPTPSATRAPAAPSRAQPPSRRDLSQLKIEFADGTTRTLAAYRGKIVVLDFWATFCQPCIDKLAHLQKLADKYPAAKLAIITVSLDPDVQTAVGWAKAHAMPLPIARYTEDMKKTFFAGEENVVLPQTRLIDADGRLARAWGPEGTVEELEQEIQALLGK
jgi:peroxiredoxin